MSVRFASVHSSSVERNHPFVLELARRMRECASPPRSTEELQSVGLKSVSPMIASDGSGDIRLDLDSGLHLSIQMTPQSISSLKSAIAEVETLLAPPDPKHFKN